MTTYTLRHCDTDMRPLPGSPPQHPASRDRSLDVEALVPDITSPHHAHTTLQIVITGDDAADTPGEVLVYFTTCG